MSTPPPDVDAAFASWSVADAPEAELVAYLCQLCGPIPNDAVRHRAVIRGITINHLRTERTLRRLEETIQRLDREGERLSRRMLWATVVGAILALVQLFVVFRG